MPNKPATREHPMILIFFMLLHCGKKWIIELNLKSEFVYLPAKSEHKGANEVN